MAKPYKPWFIIGDNGGQVHISRQSSGLSKIDMAGKTVLDIGCAEGLVSIQCAERGAKLVHGFELRERTVEVARSLVGNTGMSDRVKFFQGDLHNAKAALHQDGMLDKYDVVLGNAVLHKFTKSADAAQLAFNLCNETIVVRLGDRRLRISRWRSTDVVDFAARSGFKMDWEGEGYPQGDPPHSKDGEAWMAVFQRVP